MYVYALSATLHIEDLILGNKAIMLLHSCTDIVQFIALKAHYNLSNKSRLIHLIFIEAQTSSMSSFHQPPVDITSMLSFGLNEYLSAGGARVNTWATAA